MKNKKDYEFYLEKDDHNQMHSILSKILFELRRIGDILEEKNLNLENKSLSQSLNESIIDEINNSLVENNRNSPEMDLTKLLTEVYKDEEIERRRTQATKKSARRVSKRLYNRLQRFFQNILGSNYIVTTGDGHLIITKDHDTTFIVKFFIDLGYNGRGHLLNDTIRRLVQKYKELYNVEEKNIFFFVVSWVNSLDNKHVTTILNKDISNSKLIGKENRKLLRKFINQYINNINALSNPNDNFFYLLAEYHPNILANKYLDSGNIVFNRLINYDFLKPSISELVNKIKTYK